MVACSHWTFCSAVVGRAPLVGEKVLVKAVQDPSQSVKWTAQRVQVLNGQVSCQDMLTLYASNLPLDYKRQLDFILPVFSDKPFKSPPPLLHSTTPNLTPGILGNKRQPLLKSPKIPPLIPGMQPNPGKLHQRTMLYSSSKYSLYVNMVKHTHMYVCVCVDIYTHTDFLLRWHAPDAPPSEAAVDCPLGWGKQEET